MSVGVYKRINIGIICAKFRICFILFPCCSYKIHYIYIVSIFEFSPRIAALAPPNIDFVLLVLTGLEEGGRMLSKGFEFIICKYFILPT